MVMMVRAISAPMQLTTGTGEHRGYQQHATCRTGQCSAMQSKIGEIGIIDEICLGRVIKPFRGGGCISSIACLVRARMSSTPKQPRHRHDARMIDYLLPTCRYIHVTLWGHDHPAASAAGDKQKHLLHVAVRHQQQLRSPTSSAH